MGNSADPVTLWFSPSETEICCRSGCLAVCSVAESISLILFALSEGSLQPSVKKKNKSKTL